MTPQQLPVSVIIPAHNRRNQLLRALRSIDGQHAGAPTEVIVVDDHSDDDTGEVAAAWGARVIRHERNLGAAAARNTAVQAARCPWIAPLDSDDEWLPNHLATLWSLRGEHVLVGGAVLACFDPGTSRQPEYEGPVKRGPQLLRSPGDLIPFNVVTNSAALVRTDVIRAAGGYDTALPYAEDWDLWLRVLDHGTGLVTPEIICRYHRHPGQKSGHERGPRESHDRLVLGCADRPWWSERIADRWYGIRLWEGLEAAVRDRRPVDVITLAGRLAYRPRRPWSVVSLRIRWLRAQRRTRELRASGEADRIGAAPPLEPAAS